MRWAANIFKKLTAVLAIAMLFSTIVHAESTTSISQGYQSTEKLAQGSLVSLEKGKDKVVVLTNSSNVENLVGVVVEANQTLLSLSSSDTNVHVATSGIALALVTNLGGDIRAGDRIAISSITGVGMRASVSGRVLGIAQADFNASSADTKVIEVTTKAGAKQKTRVGRIPVLVNIGNYAPESVQDTILPTAVQKTFDSIANRQVSVLRILIALILLALSIIVVTVLIYGSVRSSIISIGRNPLSQPAIRRSLFQVIVISAAILLVTLISVYLIISR